jgi:hypothetical protein
MVGGPVVSFDTVGVEPKVLMKVGAGLGGSVLQISTLPQLPAKKDPVPKLALQHAWTVS